LWWILPCNPILKRLATLRLLIDSIHMGVASKGRWKECLHAMPHPIDRRMVKDVSIVQELWKEVVKFV
jgi:hypothetical protein